MNIGIYFDLENVTNLNLNNLVEELEADTGGGRHVIAVKTAVGNSSSITANRKQLVDANFTIMEVPHLANRKNRADLVLSVEALDDAVCNTPPVERFVFITSDSDFTVIMDKLKRKGKEVWLLCKETDTEKPFFKSCTSKIMPIEHNSMGKKHMDELKSFLKSNGFNDNECRMLIDYFKDNTRRKADNLNFNYSGKKIKNQKALLTKLIEEYFLEKTKEGKSNVYRLLVKD